MADERVRATTEPLILRGEDERFLAARDVAAEVTNFVATEEGTLRSVDGPAPYVVNYATGGAHVSGVAAKASKPLTWGPMRAVCHAKLRGGTLDITLVATGNQVWEYYSSIPDAQVRPIVGPQGSGALYTMTLEASEANQFPFQLIPLPNGILILPPDKRALFFDGDVCAPLGYSTIPGPPTLMGPMSPLQVDTNTFGFVHDRNGGLPWSPFGGAEDVLIQQAGVGTIKPAPEGGTAGGVLEEGRYVAAVQFMDRWANLSPVSLPSNPVRLSRQVSASGERVASLLKTLLWADIPKGPTGTIARNALRSRDLMNAETDAFYVVPGYALEQGAGLTAIPDNQTRNFVDNIGDERLIEEAVHPVPVPVFRLACQGFGRLFIANFKGDPGRLRWSMPGRYGTFLKGDDIYPDPAGGELTGVYATAGGVIATTRSSTFFISPSDDGQSFIRRQVSSKIGCVAPKTIRATYDGAVVWLSERGLARFDGASVELLTDGSQRTLRRINRSRARQACAVVDPRSGEYRCWVPVDGSTYNNLCLVWDNGFMRRRDEMDHVADACVTQDGREHVLLAGICSGYNGLWVQDVFSKYWNVGTPDGVIETTWIGASNAGERQSGFQVTLWMRETAAVSTKTLDIEVMRDWRETVVHTASVKLYSSDDPPPTWGTTAWGSSNTWARRRPYWVRADIYIPSAETFKLRFKPAGVGDPPVRPWEFIGLRIASAPRGAGYSRTPP